MNEQHPEHPEQPEQPEAPQQPGQQPGQPRDDRPQYGIRLTPEQQAEHQARLSQAQQERQERQAQQGQHPAPPYGQPPQGPSPYGQPPQGQNAYGQAPYGQSPYGQHPQGYSPYGQPPANQPGPGYGYPGQDVPQQLGPITKPSTIDRSYWLILAAGLAFLVIELFSLFSPNMGLTPEMLDLYQEQMDAAGVAIEMESFLASVRIFAVVFTVLLVVLYWLIATGIRRGSNVARIFGTIFAVLSLTSVFGPGLIYVALGIAGIVFAYLRPSSEYLRAKAWEKAMRR
ncbi:hypothetical protein GCM10010977_18860 [Citricoccus zhacaiensis]|uniref:DUF4064 domain-containing protein n=1 Tax=Citricoccus zhacaiensis TaxID=489142 RepID=A0ABQ2M150_9MICC|nr:hypothetical protein [Citricoccus zhacaiensis]GGO45658.1 hypothetical protein GCM10010977_18860 [Citricoccus zhacaiensis]